jgi:DNA-binding response OmpR family regulator
MNIACYLRDEAVFRHVQGIFVHAGFECEHLSSESVALRTLRQRSFNMVLTDIVADFLDGEHFFSDLATRDGDHTPLVVLSEGHSAEVVAQILNNGADDYWRLPVNAVELLARARAVLRRFNRRHIRRVIKLGGFSIDREANKFSFQDTPIELTPREFTMAWLFFSSPGTYITRETIGSAIWGVRSAIAARTIEQHVYKLRKKLQLGPERGVMIRTAYSHGYRLEHMTAEMG